MHPKGGCGLKRHSPYVRKRPAGVVVPRWYCPQSGVTFSALADFAAARLSDSLAGVEAIVARVEQARAQGGSLIDVAAEVWPGVEAQGARRAIHRRVRSVRQALLAGVGILPELFEVPPTIWSVRKALGAGTDVLGEIRRRMTKHLSSLASPVGFRHRGTGASGAPRSQQHKVGPDFVVRVSVSPPTPP